MKKLLFAAVAAIACTCARADLITDYAGLSAAIDAAEDGATIKLKAGTIAFSAPLAVSKGITLSGGWTDESTRADGAMTTFDGETTQDILLVNNDAGVGVAIENVRFYRALTHGCEKTGAGDISFTDCTFEANGSKVYPNQGLGVKLSGGQAATASFRNCTFTCNRVGITSWTKYSVGIGIYASQCALVTLNDCAFTQNGIDWDVKLNWELGGGNTKGVCVYSDSSRIVARNCRFAGNMGYCYNGGAGGAAVVNLEGDSSGSAFTNCLFVGNETVSSLSSDRWSNGSIAMNLSPSSGTVDIDRCTFAYNISGATKGSAGLTVCSGRAKVRNSIFYGNWQDTGADGGADLTVGVNGFADVAWSHFTENSATYVIGATLGDGVSFGDAGLVTPLATVDALIEHKTTSTRYKQNTSLDAVLAFDVHPLATSKTLDGGDPSVACVEPLPNGSRINVGAYANTSEAMTSSPAAPTLSALDVTFPDGYTMPNVALTLGSDGAGDYNAVLTVYSTTGDVATTGWLFTNKVSALHNGDSETVSPGAYFKPGDSYSVRAEAWVAGQTTAVATKDVTVTGTLPPWVGHGGGANVIHVRENAAGKATGVDWTDAFPDMASAVAAVTDGKTEIWVAGHVVYSSTPGTLAPTVPFAIRGGFTGGEDTADQRPSGRFSTLDGADAFETLTIANDKEKTVTIERIRFYHAKSHGCEKTGKGDIVFDSCRFELNGLGVADTDGRGIKLSSGSSAATAWVTNCVFEGNIAGTIASTTEQLGGGIYADAFARLFVDDSLFITNGVRYGKGTGFPPAGTVNNLKGAALYANNTPVTLRGSRFIGNVAPMRIQYGGTVTLVGNGGASAISNCTFVANQTVRSYTTGDTRTADGAICVRFSSNSSLLDVNCATVAYNISDSGTGAGGLGVESGTVTVRNSVFYGNVRQVGGLSGADIAVSGSGSVAMDYSHLTAKAATSYSGAVTLGENVTEGDPKFVTPLSAMETAITRKDNDGYRAFYDDDVRETVCAFDVHLLSKLGHYLNDGTKTTASVDSPLLDAGDPSADYSNETLPNGNRLNIGAYANTAEASNSDVSQPDITSVAVTYPTEYTQPQVAVTLGVAGGGDGSYGATVTVVTEVAGGRSYTNTVTGAHCGDVVTVLVPAYFEPNAQLTVTAAALVSGFDPVVSPVAHTIDPTKTKPAFCGHGGGAGVIHVREGAACLRDGTDWENAYADLASAFAAVDAGRSEIWISGTFVTPAQVVVAPPCPVTVRGGFTALEDTAAARPAGTLAVLDGAKGVDILSVANTSGRAVTFERIRFTRAKEVALAKTENGALVVDGCQFDLNGGYVTFGKGNALNLTGADAEVTVTNCVFEGHASSLEYVNGFNYTDQNGSAIYAETLGALAIDNCAFVTNGVPITNGNPHSPFAMSVSGGCIMATDVPLTVRRTRFVGNVARILISSMGTASGHLVALKGSSPASFENCLFVGNQSLLILPFEIYDYSRYSGVLGVSLTGDDGVVSLSNCTMAYNIGTSHYAGGGIDADAGRIVLENSIVFGNLRHGNALGGSDVSLRGTAVLEANYTMFTDATTNSITCTESATTNFRNVSYGDPRFVTTNGTLRPLVTVMNGLWSIHPTNYPALCAINVHLRGRGYLDELTGEQTAAYRKADLSPAIDAGDPESPYKAEPSPNGCRVNLGFYGNTPWASMSPGGFLILVK